MYSDKGKTLTDTGVNRKCWVTLHCSNFIIFLKLFSEKVLLIHGMSKKENKKNIFYYFERNRIFFKKITKIGSELIL